MPRSARHGYLCDACWLKAQDALNRVGDLILHLRSVESAATATGERVDSTRTPKLPFPDTWQAADDLLDALGARPFPSRMSIDSAFEYVDAVLATWRGPHLIDRANTIEGASGLVKLVLRMQTALARWPASEVKVRVIPYITCPSCKHQTLERRAPLDYLDQITVRCSRQGCSYERDWFEWLELYSPIIAGIFDEHENGSGRRQKVRITLPKKPARSTQCEHEEHSSCRSLTCQCDCHERRSSLYSIKIPFHVLKAMKQANEQRTDATPTDMP